MVVSSSAFGQKAKLSLDTFPTKQDVTTRLLLTEYRGFVITPPLTNGTTLTPKTTQQTMHPEVEELEN